MKDKPYQPPAHDPNDDRRVGHGTDFGVELFELLRAGRTSLPTYAVLYSDLTTVTHDLGPRIDFLRQSVGGEYALSLVDGLRQELQVCLRIHSLALQDAGEALVQIADDFAATDQQANDTFRSLAKGADLDVPQVPQPPGLNAPHRDTYDPPPLDAPDIVWGVDQGHDAPRSPFDGPGLDDEGDLDDQVPDTPDESHVPDPDDYVPDFLQDNPWYDEDRKREDDAERYGDLDSPWREVEVPRDNGYGYSNRRNG